MKKIALWLSVMALGLCLGCTPPPKPNVKVNLKFRRGQVINLKIGGRGQIIDVDDTPGDTCPYCIRINTNEGPKYKWFQEFELEIDPWGWEPS